MTERFDVAVVGAGFGGMAAALRLAELGARVVLFEALKYPGGCASTFTRGGWRFESGATLFSGFAPGQLFDRWITRHAWPVVAREIDPVIELRTRAYTLRVPPRREGLVDDIVRASGPSHERGVRAFFDHQRRLADALWALFDDPALLPPFDLRALGTHCLRAPKYLALLPWIGRPLGALLAHHGVADVEPLRVWLDSTCQITVQTDAASAETPFAAAAIDYCFRGTRHIHGGVGALASAMAATVTSLGGVVRMPDRVDRLSRAPDGWTVHARRGDVTAPVVVANVLPHDLAALVGDALPSLDALSRRVETGWGAAMLYLGVARDAALRPEAHHLELVDDTSRPFVEGNHVFASISGLDEPERAPDGARTVTVSTHVPLATMRAMPESAQGDYIADVQRAMTATLTRLAPSLVERVVHRLPASPRTFARFTRRHGGFVGGVPRRAGLSHYAGMRPSPVAPGLYMVGDSVFPGQSTLATALGGVKLAEHLAKK